MLWRLSLTLPQTKPVESAFGGWELLGYARTFLVWSCTGEVPGSANRQAHLTLCRAAPFEADC